MQSMAASQSKTLSLIFRAATRKTTSIVSKPTSTATKPTKSVARSTTKSPKLASSSSSASYADVSDSEPLNHSYDEVCGSVFEKDQSSNGRTTLSELVSYHLSGLGPEPSQGVLQDEHVEFSDKPLVRQVSSTISGTSDFSCLRKSDSEEARTSNAEGMLSTMQTCIITSPDVTKSDLEEARSLNAEGVLSSMQTCIRITSPDAHNCVSQHRKEVSRERKQKWIFKNTQTVKFQNLVQTCATRFGADDTIKIFGRLGRETGLKEYKMLIEMCVKTAKESEEGALLEQIYRAYTLFKSMKEEGFHIDEETYGPFLMFLIEMHMVDEFSVFLDIIKDENPSSNAQLGYYEMLLAIEVSDETKIQDFCNQVAPCGSGRISILQENYLIALCEKDRMKELLEVLERINVTQVSSVEKLSCIFSSLGRLSLELFALRVISELKECDERAQSVSILILNYATSIPNLTVEEVVLKFKSMHAESELLPSSLSYEKLIKFCCNSLEVHEALNVANQMFEAGLASSVETINSILHSCEENGEYHLAPSIYSMLRRFNWASNSETYRSLISLFVRMKDIHRAYSMLGDLEEVNVSPTSSMYTYIMAGFYREKNVKGALEVFKRMEAANVKPDSITFSYLIANSDSEEDITKYYEKLKSSGIQPTKHIFMSLINAYVNCGKFEEAKQVVFDNGIEVKEINEVKSALVSALASHGRIYDALEVYEDMKLCGCSLEPKAIVGLIEHLQSTEKLSTMIQLVCQLTDTDYWIDGSCRVIGYCVRNKNLRAAVELLDEVINKFHDDFIVAENVVNEVFSHVASLEPSDVQFGLDLLQALKDELMLHPTRRSLDFLLSTCVTAKDSKSAALIWEEYGTAGLPHNILGFLRMYQVFLASGDKKSAEDIINKMQSDDPHVHAVVRACRAAYPTPSKSKKKEKKKKKK